MTRGNSHDEKQENLVRSQGREDMVWTILFSLFICIFLHFPVYFLAAEFLVGNPGMILSLEFALLTISVVFGCWYWKREVNTSRWFFTRRGRLTCLHCGYQLRGITADQCPECGNEFYVRQSPGSDDEQGTPLT